MTTASRFDADLLRRYDRPGPRYTSYPSALYFDEKVDPEPMLEYSRQNADPEKVQAFAELGMNRASFGIQDSNPDVQEAYSKTL